MCYSFVNSISQQQCFIIIMKSGFHGNVFTFTNTKHDNNICTNVNHGYHPDWLICKCHLNMDICCSHWNFVDAGYKNGWQVCVCVWGVGVTLTFTYNTKYFVLVHHISLLPMPLTYELIKWQQTSTMFLLIHNSSHKATISPSTK